MSDEHQGVRARFLSGRRLVAGVAVATAVVVAAACGTGGTNAGGGVGAEGEGNGAAGESGTAAGGASSGVGAGGSNGATGGTSSSAGGATGVGAGGSVNGFGGGVTLPDASTPDVLPEGCDGVEQQANRVPLTVYLVVDRSASMAGDKWVAAREGLKAFLKDKASDKLTVGLTFFPAEKLKAEECSFKNYLDPLVPFGVLPDQANTFVDGLDAATPSGYGTPIYPALGGALERGVAAHMLKPNENFVVLLVTDGQPEKPPESCSMADPLSTDSIAALVEKASKSFGVKTYVVGLPGVNPMFANAIAKAGGGEAILVTTNVDVQKQFQTALDKVRGESLGCEFPLPADSSKYDKDLVNVRFTSGTGMVSDLSRSPGCAMGEGWDYDNADKPTKIVLCKASCEKAKEDGLGKVQIVLGCPTRIL